MRIALIASGGGHVRQLLDLEPLWGGEDHFFVSEDTALTRSLAADHRSYFVPHVALGQARLGHPLRMLSAAARNLYLSLWIILRERPDVIITTGAGSCYFSILFARLIGTKIVLIDSFARFRGPSAFAKIASPLAHVRICQSKEAASKWPGSSVVDPFRLLEASERDKERLVFATVGATLKFDRLVRHVVEAKRNGLLPEKVVLQTGTGNTIAIDESIEAHEMIPFDALQDYLKRADIVICHGGTGSIITALRQNCRVVVIPRLFERGEHYDNHQWEIAECFADRGLISMVGADDDFSTALASARNRPPQPATLDQSDLLKRLGELLSGWEAKLQPKAGKALPPVDQPRFD